MNTKLTLTINKNIINGAKQYASGHKISLSKLVEFYFSSLLSRKHDKKEALGPITSKLAGMIKNAANIDEKKILSDGISEKYS